MYFKDVPLSKWPLAVAKSDCICKPKVTEDVKFLSLTNCNCCRVRYQSLLSISLCYVLVTPRYHMSKARALSLFAISFLYKRAYLVSWIRELIAKVILGLVY